MYFLPAHHRYNVDSLFGFFEKINSAELLKFTHNSPVCEKLLELDSNVRSAMANFAVRKRTISYTYKDSHGLPVKRSKPIYETRSHQLAKYHFIYSKKVEFDLISGKPIEEVMLQLETDRNELAKYSFPNSADLLQWEKVFSYVRDDG